MTDPTEHHRPTATPNRPTLEHPAHPNPLGHPNHHDPPHHRNRPDSPHRQDLSDLLDHPSQSGTQGQPDYPNHPDLLGQPDQPDQPDRSATRTANQQPQPDRHVDLGKDAIGVALPGPLIEADRDLQRSRVVWLVGEPEGIADVAHVEHMAEKRRHVDVAGGDETQRLAE